MEPIKPLLRPDQIQEMEGERQGLEQKLKSPHIEDKGIVSEQLRRLDKQLESQRPTEYSRAIVNGASEIDTAVRREAELRETWLAGMPSHEEMRKCPPGMVGRHTAWEKKNKPIIAEWKAIRQRLNIGSDDPDVASIELYRPIASRSNLDNAIVQGKQFYLPPEGAKSSVLFTDEQLAALKAIFPEAADRIGTLSNEARAEVKKELTQAQIDGRKGYERREAKIKAEKPKRKLSPEHLAKLQAGRAAKMAEAEVTA